MKISASDRSLGGTIAFNISCLLPSAQKNVCANLNVLCHTLNDISLLCSGLASKTLFAYIKNYYINEIAAV